MRCRDPRPYLIEKPPRPQRYRRGKGPRYVPDVVEQARVLMVGTTWPVREIAERIGIAPTTIHRWKAARGWTRPLDASISTGKVTIARAGLARRCREALRTLEAMAVREVLRSRDANGESHRRLEKATSLLVRVLAASRPSRRRAA